MIFDDYISNDISPMDVRFDSTYSSTSSNEFYINTSYPLIYVSIGCALLLIFLIIMIFLYEYFYIKCIKSNLTNISNNDNDDIILNTTTCQTIVIDLYPPKYTDLFPDIDLN